MSSIQFVLARWVTLNDYFHLTDRPYETFRPEHDEYVTPTSPRPSPRRRTAGLAEGNARTPPPSSMRSMPPVP